MSKFLAYKDSNGELRLVSVPSLDAVDLVQNPKVVVNLLVEGNAPIPVTPVFALIINT